MSKQSPEYLLKHSRRLYDKARVDDAVKQVAEDLTNLLNGEPAIMLTVMNGGMIPAAWVAARIDSPLRMDFVHATRYRGETQGGGLRFRVHPSMPIAGETVVVFDDIFDEGYTLQAICEYCEAQRAKQVISAVLVRKDHDRGLPRDWVDLVGLEVPDVYVFGCGMDVHEYWRQLDDIRALELPE